MEGRDRGTIGLQIQRLKIQPHIHRIPTNLAAETYSPEDIQRIITDTASLPRRAPPGAVAFTKTTVELEVVASSLKKLIVQLSITLKPYVGANNKINKYLSAEDFARLQAHVSEHSAPTSPEDFTSLYAASRLLRTSEPIIVRAASQLSLDLHRMKGRKNGKIGTYLSPEQVQQVREALGR